MFFVDVVPSSEDEQDSDDKLQADGEGNTSDTHCVEGILLGTVLEKEPELRCVCGQQGDVQQALSDTLLRRIEVDVHTAHFGRSIAADRVIQARERVLVCSVVTSTPLAIPTRQWILFFHLLLTPM